MTTQNGSSVALDYIRIAAWSPRAYTGVLARIMTAWPEEWKQGNWLQYAGWRKEGFFIGHGEQRRKSHTIINVSGELSQRLLPTLKNLTGWYSTRLDVQMTIDHPKRDDRRLSYVRDACKGSNTTLIESNENDTLYLGSRTSDLFTRLYEKYLDDKPYLRLEFELKGTRSRAAWEAITMGEPLSNIFKYYLDRSRLPDFAKLWFKDETAIATAEAMNSARLENAKKKLAWIRSLDACMEKSMGDHDIGDEVKEIVRSWAKYANHLDNLDEES